MDFLFGLMFSNVLYCTVNEINKGSLNFFCSQTTGSSDTSSDTASDEDSDSLSTSSDETSSSLDDSSSNSTHDSDFEFWSDEELVESFENQDYEIQEREADFDRSHVTESTLLEEREMELCTTYEHDSSVYAPFCSNVNEINGKLESMLQTMFKEEISETNIVNRDRLLVSVEKLIELRGNQCDSALHDGNKCQEEVCFDAECRGSVLKLRWECAIGHKGLWVSSEVVNVATSPPVFVNDILFTACVVMSGNHYGKVSLLSKFLNLKIPSQSTFTRNQRFFIVPVILEAWTELKSNITGIVKAYKDLCLIGDGRNDSPGFSARYCVYVLMEQLTGIIIDVEILDRRETGGHSPNMEREGLTRLLERLMKTLDISEVVTDASSSIIKRLGDLKGEIL